MRTHIRRFGILTATVAAFAVLLAGCSVFGGGTGTVKLSLTDAPIDAANVTGVYITITDIAYNHNGDWIEAADYEGGTYNLLELTGGESTPLSEISLQSGTYEQIRFILEAPNRGDQAPSNPGTYIEFDTDSNGEGDQKEALFVPGGSQSGYKLVSAFQVPRNGTVDLVVDFDAREAVVDAGQNYILKPAMRLIVNNQAGRITGNISGVGTAEKYTVLAYEDGAYTNDEEDLGAEENRFPEAVTSFTVTADGSYTLAYLAADPNYDLYVAKYTDTDGDGTFTLEGVAQGPQDVVVEADAVTSNQSIDVSQLTFGRNILTSSTD